MPTRSRYETLHDAELMVLNGFKFCVLEIKGHVAVPRLRNRFSVGHRRS